MNKFKMIPREQTPAVNPIMDIGTYIMNHKDEFIDFMKYARKRKDAAGLAANQLSLNGERFMKRVCAIKNKHQWTLAIDPKIIKTTGENIEVEEGCLTWPGMKMNVIRNTNIQVGYFSLDGTHLLRVCNGFESQIWQHEIDHLNGVVENYNRT